MARTEAPSQRQSYWLLAAATAACLPMATHLPPGFALAALLALAWAGLTWRGLVRAPPRWLLALLVLAGAGAVVVYYRTPFGRNPGVALLVLLFALKLLELRRVRDGYAIVLLDFFVVFAQFFYTQSIASATLALLALTLNCAALAVLNQASQTGRSALTLCAAMLAQATPLMLVFFVLFPRVSGPLWGLPGDSHAGLTGLSDSMSPGSISFLSQSDAIAFRVQFAGAQPPQRELYWRGPVLTRFDGRTWSASRGAALRRLPYEPHGSAVDYSVTLEAHGKPWLFALELPALLPPDSFISSDYQLLARTPVRARQRYDMRSYPATVAGGGEAASGLREALRLPAALNPRARALAQTWRAEAGGDAGAIVRRLLAYYREQPFSYTLTPPLLGEQAMDEFLLESRSGFCEHYAASFVFMMRAAGVPARVVTGYQGGEFNPVDQTLIVRQYDAHAWAEVWIDGSGWQRVDPTAAIAPSRIETNLAAALPAGEPLPLLARPAFLWLHDLRFRWDALTNAWNQRVLGYNPLRQRELLQSLGMRAPDWKTMTLVLSILSSLMLAAMSAWALLNRRRPDPAERAWRRLSAKLSRRGLARRPWEGARDYAGRVAAAAPALAAEVGAIADLYQELRYGRAPAADLLALLRRRVRHFNP